MSVVESAEPKKEVKLVRLSESPGPVFMIEFPEKNPDGSSYNATRTYLYVPPAVGEPGNTESLFLFYPAVHACEMSCKLSYRGSEIVKSIPMPRGVFLDKKLEIELLFTGLAFEHAYDYAHHLKECTVVDDVENTIPVARWRRDWNVRGSFRFAPEIFGKDTNYYEYGDSVRKFIEESDFIQANIQKFTEWVEAGRPSK